MKNPTKYRGLTLLSVLAATVIIGVAVPAVLQLVGTCTMAVGSNAQLTTAIELARHLEEYALLQPIKSETGVYKRTGNVVPDNVCALDGQNYSPPINSDNQQLAGLPGWSQKCTVQVFEPAMPSFLKDLSHATDTNARLLTVEVQYQGQTIFKAQRVLAPTIGL